MSVSREELIQFLEEAESREDWETANQVLDKIEAMQTSTPPKFQRQDWTPNPDYSPGINPIQGTAEALLQGATFGLSDEIQAGIAALTTPELPPSGITREGKMTALERYRQTLDETRNKVNQYRQQEGWRAYVPEIIGGAVTGLGGLAKTGTLKGGAAVGGLEGGMAGAGYADAEEFFSPETALNSAVGTAVGTGVGFTAPLAGRFLKKGAAAVGDAISDRMPNFTGRTAKIVAEEAATGAKPDIAARYTFKQNAAGKPTASRDTLAIKAIDDLEIPQPIVRSIQELSPDDKTAARKMLNIIKLGKKNTAFADKNRPGDVLGDTLKSKVDFIAGERKRAGAELDRLVSTKLKGKPVAVDDALQNFAAQLDDLGVKINQSKSGKITPDFDGALKLNTNDRKPIREAIRKINRVIESGRPTADVVHDLKRALDNEIPWDSSSKMTSEGEQLLKGLRSDLNKSLQDTFPGYAETNKVLEDTIGTMNTIADAMGRKYDPTSPNADKYLGQELRKLATNYNSRVPLTDAIDRVEEISRKYGLESGGDVSRQATMVNDLEDLFGPAARRGFRAEIQKATRDGITDTAKRTIRGDKGAVVDKVFDKANELISNVDEEKQFDILNKLLTRN